MDNSRRNNEWISVANLFLKPNKGHRSMTLLFSVECRMCRETGLFDCKICITGEKKLLFKFGTHCNQRRYLSHSRVLIVSWAQTVNSISRNRKYQNQALSYLVVYVRKDTVTNQFFIIKKTNQIHFPHSTTAEIVAVQTCMHSSRMRTARLSYGRGGASFPHGQNDRCM